MENWENKKKFNFSHFCLVMGEKVERWNKVSLYKFTHTPLLKNDGQLKHKKNKQQKKKSNHPIY